jgi:biotin carboxyl carrier protein
MPPTEEGAARERWAEIAQRVRDIAATCADSGLVRVRVADADMEIDVRRRGSPSPLPQARAQSERAIEETPSSNGAVNGAPEPDVLTADVVGIVRLSRPAVHEGALLASERELAYVESLGIRNPVRSRGTGRVLRIFVDDGQAVDYGQPLFAIER